MAEVESQADDPKVIRDDSGNQPISENSETDADLSDGGVQFFRVTSLSSSGAAYLNGMQRGDIIVGVEGRLNKNDYADFVNNVRTKTDQETFLSYVRNDQLLHTFIKGYLGVEVDSVTPGATRQIQEIIERDGMFGRSGCQPYSVYVNRYSKSEVRNNLPSMLSLICPPLWMLSQRYVEGFFACLLVYITCIIVNPYLFLLIYLAFSYSCWREQRKFIDLFMLRLGYQPMLRLAGFSEEYIQMKVLKLNEAIEFMFPCSEAVIAREKYLEKVAIEKKKAEAEKAD